MRRATPLLLVLFTGCQGMAKGSNLPDFDRDWDYRDPAATETRFRQVLPVAEASDDADYHAQLLTQIARTHSLRGNFEEAHALLDEVHGMLGRDTDVAQLRYLLERGRTHNSAGERERATELFLEAWELAREAGEEFHAADALHVLGISTPPDEALAWNERAIEYSEGCADERAKKWLGPLYQNTWHTYLEKGELETALGWAEKARAYRASIRDEDGERVARWCVYHTWRKLGRVDEALEAQLDLLVDHGEEGDPTGYTQEEIGECLLLLGRGDEAVPYFAAAYDRLSKDEWFSKNEAERLARLSELGAR